MSDGSWIALDARLFASHKSRESLGKEELTSAETHTSVSIISSS